MQTNKKKITIYVMKFYSSQQAFPFSLAFSFAFSFGYNFMIYTHSTLYFIDSAAAAAASAVSTKLADTEQEENERLSDAWQKGKQDGKLIINS